MQIQRFYRALVYSVVASLALFSTTTPIQAQIILNEAGSSTPSAQSGYPPDPPSEIPWRYGISEWSEVVAAFNDAREQENAMLGLSLAPMIFPAAESWQAMSSGEKALWLINEERTARGLAPLQGLEQNINEVAQGYAEWMLANNEFDHRADGRSPWERMNANPAIGACHDFLSIGENLYFYATSEAQSVPFFIEQAVYVMMYEDAGPEWGHRHAILWTPYTENNDEPDREGFLGIGHASGPYTIDGTFYQSADILVMNFFDPCATWGETPPDEGQPTPTASPSPTPSPTSAPAPSATPTPIPQPTEPSNPPRRTISGRVITLAENESGVSQAALGLSGVTITSDNGQTTQTDANGEFILEGLAPGKRIFTPSKTGYIFLPSSIELDLSVGDLEGINFTSSSGPAGADLSFALHLPLISPTTNSR